MYPQRTFKKQEFLLIILYFNKIYSPKEVLHFRTYSYKCNEDFSILFQFTDTCDLYIIQKTATFNYLKPEIRIVFGGQLRNRIQLRLMGGNKILPGSSMRECAQELRNRSSHFTLTILFLKYFKRGLVNIRFIFYKIRFSDFFNIEVS